MGKGQGADNASEVRGGRGGGSDLTLGGLEAHVACGFISGSQDACWGVGERTQWEPVWRCPGGGCTLEGSPDQRMGTL